MTPVEVEADLLSKFSKEEYRSHGPDRPGRVIAFAGDSQDPHPVYLLPHEILLERKPVEIRSSSPISPLEALTRVTHATSIEEIGAYPVLAAINTEENSGNSELELFKVEFARDELRVALDLIDEFPQISMTAIKSLAGTQGVSWHHAREEERGKIVHENRPAGDPIAIRITQEKGWGWPYYGAIDTTPGFVTLIDAYIQAQKDRSVLDERYLDKSGEEQDIRHAAELAMEWLSGRLEKSPAGLFEYRQETPGGIENQVWRDSREAYHHADGRLADNAYGIASFSAQIDAYKALQAASRLFPEKGKEYLQKADDLKKKILDFWIEDSEGGYFALGDERKADNSYELLKIRTSDMGHILDSDILEGEDTDIMRKKEMLVRTLFSPSMLATSGIRSLGRNELRYNPGAYHNGSVWPRENSIIATGLARQGYPELAFELHKRNANVHSVSGIFPEKVSGDDFPEPRLSRRIVDAEEEGRGIYRLEQPGQEVQSWTISAIIRSLRYIKEYARHSAYKMLYSSQKV